MERFKQEVNLSLVILLLIGLFLLNACGAPNNRGIPTNIDNKDAVIMQTGTYRGSNANANLKPTFENKKVIYKEQPEQKVFKPGELIVNFDTKHVSFDTEINIDGRVQTIKLEGDFHPDTGIAIVSAKDPKDNQKIGIGSVRCDNLCKIFSAEIYVKKIDKDGNVSYPETHLQFDAEKIDAKGNPDKVINSQVPNVPNNKQLTLPTSKTFANTESGVSSTAQTKSNSQPQAQNTQSTKSSPDASMVVDEDAPEGSEATVLYHPAAIEESDKESLKAIINLSGKPDPVVTNRNPAPTNPVVNKIDDNGIDLTTFPFEMGGRYIGQAQGCYAATSCGKILSYITKATDIIQNRQGNPGMGQYLISPDSDGAKYYYGSGFLVRHLEVAAKKFAEKYPGEKITVTELSQQNGGDQRCGVTAADERSAKAKGIKCRHESHRNGLDVDLHIPRLKNNKFDYPKFAELIKILAADNTVDRFFLDIGEIRKVCPYMKDTESKKAFKMIFHWPGHKDHLHVREKCTNHNPFCYPVEYSDKDNGVNC